MVTNQVWWYVNNLCKKPNNKLLARTAGSSQSQTVFEYWKQEASYEVFFNTQFSFCPLICVLHSRCNNNKMKYLHERCLRLTYCENNSPHEELSGKSGLVSIHHRNITCFVQHLKTITISVIIITLGYLFQKQSTMKLRASHF